jgi:glycosyltransferase involved in cell wall biosynthesis
LRRGGAGLKIKTVEALAHGLPLVTTGEGARGLRELDGHALCIADSAEDFAQAIQRLLASSAARRDLGAAAFTYAQTHFTPETCFAEIADWLARGAPAAAARLNPAVAAER